MFGGKTFALCLHNFARFLDPFYLSNILINTWVKSFIMTVHVFCELIDTLCSRSRPHYGVYRCRLWHDSPLFW